MAVASMESPCPDGRDNVLVEPKTLKWRTGLDDISKVWAKRCGSSCRRRDLVLDTSIPLKTSVSQSASIEKREHIPYSLLCVSATTTCRSDIEPPPSYYDSVADEPPSYDLREDLARVQLGYRQQGQPPAYDYVPEKTIDHAGSIMAPIIDFDDTSNFRQAANKKAKKAQKQADQAKWADGGDEGNQEGGEGEQNGGEGGGSNNGDGGAGDGGGGGGGDDWNDWDTGNNKKKKGKKAKEEEKKKQEEEEKKKQEEEAANATNPLSWEDEANGDLGDDWGGFTTTTKKDKKGKKGKTESVPEKTNGTNNFDNIDLDDDTPKLDLDFGLTEKKDTGFGFGGWSGTGPGGWNSGNTWSFGNETGTTDIADSFAKATTTDIGENNSWSFGGNKKNKKKTTATNGFDFGDFGALDEEKGADPKAEDTQAGGTDDWDTGFATTGKKGKKDKKKGIFGDLSTDPDPGTIGTAIVEPEPIVEDSWGAGWGTATNKTKKKGKKGEEEPSLPPPPAPAVPVEAVAADDWGGFGTKKDKKKGKKIAEIEEPAITVVPDPEAEADTGWGSFGKKDKKKGGKKEPEKTEKPQITALPEPDLELDFGWGTTKKDKGKIKKDEKVEEPPVTDTLDHEPEADAGWGVFGKKDKKKTNKKDTEKAEETAISKERDQEPMVDEWPSFGVKKDKKKKKSIWDEPEEEEKTVNEETLEPDAAADTGWGIFGTKKDKGKKSKKDPLDDGLSPPPPPPPPAEPEPIANEKPGLLRTGSKDKKGKKGLASEVKDDPVTATDSKAATDAATSVAADDDWMSGWGGTDKKKDKKNKRNSLASSKADDAPPPPPPVPAVPDVPDVSSFDVWGSSAKKDKDKKGKKGKVTEPEPDNFTVDDPNQALNEPVQDDWAASTWGLSTKDKKKKEKEREKANKEKEEKEKREQEEQERKEEEEEEEEERPAKEKEEEEKAAKAKEKSTLKGKAGKKSKASISPEASKTKDLLSDSVPDIVPIAEEDTWGSWSASKKDKKKGSKKDMEFDLPPPAPTPPAQGLTPEPEEEEEQDDGWGSFAPVKTTKGKKDTKKDSALDDAKASKKGAKGKVEEDTEQDKPVKDEPKKKAGMKEETPAKAARSFWGGAAATSTAKSKTTKPDAKEKIEAEIKAQAEDEDDLDPDEIVGIIEEAPKKSAKDKTGAKLSKTSTKESDKITKLTDAKRSIMDDDAPAAKGKDIKAKGLNMDDVKAEDTFSSLMGSSKKTSGKKGDEAKNKIGKADWANQKASVDIGAWNEPELTELDDQPSAAQPSKTSKAAMSTAKSSKQSVLQRVKELEKNKASELIPPPPPPADPKPTSKLDKKSASNKPKDPASNKSVASKKKDLAPEPIDKTKGYKDSVPGSFPGEIEGMDDDIGDLMDAPPVEKQETKGSKKSSKSIKDSKLSSNSRETPESKRPPTPPPEPKEEKPVKKERARVVKAGGAASWGMWGAATPAKDKRASKAKDDADIVSPPKKEKAAATSGLSRAKSTRIAKEKDKETIKSDSKSSDSDKPKKTESRPPKSRGSSFGGFFGGPPTRAKSVRRSSTATSGPKLGSRRPSMDVDATGLPSPPAEDAPDVNGKAAKLMGVSGGKVDRKASTKTKQKLSGKGLTCLPEKIRDIADGEIEAAPDPYAIDSDDMVMVNGLDDPIINAPIPKKGKDKGSKSKSKEAEPELASPKKDLPDRTRSKRETRVDPGKSKRQSKAFNEDEDVVMVDGGQSDGPDVADGPDDMQFITKPKGLQRSATSSKKPESKIGGLFGAFRKSRTTGDAGDRPKSKAVVEDEVAPRKRTVTGGDDSAKRPRRDDRRRSEKVTTRAAEGYVYDTGADAAGVSEAEPADARKEERKTKRAERDRAAKEAQDEALRFEADRRAKRRAAEKDRLRDEKDRKARKAEEDREARRAAKRDKEEEQANRELEEDILKPRSKRRDTDKDGERSSRPGKSDRRRSQYDKPVALQTPDDEEARRVRRDERRAKADRRKSTAPVEDYFDPRNGKRGANIDNDPYGSGGNDHTASWVESLAKESPEPPPVEPTIMEPAPDLRASGADDLLADEDQRRNSHRKSKRSSRMYAADPVVPDPQDDRRRRRESKREGVRSGEGSAEEERYRSPRRQSDLGGVKLGTGMKTFDGKTGQGKRSSWFQKIGGRM